MKRKTKDLTDEDRRRIRGRLFIWMNSLGNAEGHLSTALHYIANPTPNKVHSKYAVAGCINTAVMRFGAITRKGDGHRLVEANQKMTQKYWAKVQSASLAGEEISRLSGVLRKVNQYRDNLLAHSNAEHLMPIGYDIVEAMSVSGKLGLDVDEIAFWRDCTKKLMVGDVSPGWSLI